jgi:hypothetical protein
VYASKSNKSINTILRSHIILFLFLLILSKKTCTLRDKIHNFALECTSIEQWLQKEAQNFDVPSVDMLYSISYLPIDVGHAAPPVTGGRRDAPGALAARGEDRGDAAAV